MYNAQSDYYPAASAQQDVVVAPPQPAREGKAYYDAQSSYQQANAKPGVPEKIEEPEPTVSCDLDFIFSTALDQAFSTF